eukprot:TRINITY_DN16960_c0_g1_i1.p1 TRINITY_DN16960_c0_g1~~TRINITY_DN16960_c0_g1_i1.p1  ORF type:complete len:668 (-),score=214.35 TRINITY_DN16960_c0_g1_i1:223-2109(-)
MAGDNLDERTQKLLAEQRQRETLLEKLWNAVDVHNNGRLDQATFEQLINASVADPAPLHALKAHVRPSQCDRKAFTDAIRGVHRDDIDAFAVAVRSLKQVATQLHFDRQQEDLQRETLLDGVFKAMLEHDDDDLVDRRRIRMMQKVNLLDEDTLNKLFKTKEEVGRVEFSKVFHMMHRGNLAAFRAAAKKMRELAEGADPYSNEGEEAIVRLSERIEELSAELDVMHKVKTDAEKRADAVTKAARELTASNEATVRTIARLLRLHNIEASGSTHDLDSAVKMLSRELEKRDVTILQLSSELKKVGEELDTMRPLAAYKDDRIAELQVQVAARDKELYLQQTEIAAMNVDLASARQTLSEQKESIRMKQAELVKARQKSEDAARDVAIVEDVFKQLVRIHAPALEEGPVIQGLKELKTSLDMTKISELKLQDEVSMTSRDLLHLRDIVRQQDEEIKTMHFQLESKKHEMRTLNKDLHRSRMDHETLQHRQEKAEEDLEFKAWSQTQALEASERGLQKHEDLLQSISGIVMRMSSSTTQLQGEDLVNGLKRLQAQKEEQHEAMVALSKEMGETKQEVKGQMKLIRQLEEELKLAAQVREFSSSSPAQPAPAVPEKRSFSPFGRSRAGKTN